MIPRPPKKPKKSRREPKPDRQGQGESNLVSTETWALLCALQRGDLSDLERPTAPERRPNAKIRAVTGERQNAPSEWSRGSGVTPDLGLRLWRNKVKALSFGFPEYRVKRAPERDFRGGNVK